MAKMEGADIYFGDAAHMRSDHHAGRTWGKKGETPVVEAAGARRGMSLISAITSRGEMRLMIKEKGGPARFECLILNHYCPTNVKAASDNPLRHMEDWIS